MTVGLALLAGCLLVVIAMLLIENSLMREKAIKSGAARHNPQTGKFEWLEVEQKARTE